MEDFLTFELAKKLKEKGFPQDIAEKSFFVGDNEKRGCRIGDFVHHPVENKKHLIAAPTISQVLKWLRGKNQLFVGLSLFKDGYEAYIQSTNFEEGKDYTDMWIVKGFHQTCEQAALAGIEYVLDNLI